MQQIFDFLRRNTTFLLFVFLFSFAVALSIQAHSYHRNKYINASNDISGGLHSLSYTVINYFNLQEENEILLQENKRLKKIISTIEFNKVDTTSTDFQFKYLNAKVYRNTTLKLDNYLVINKGLNDGVKEDFGVITSKGVVGIVNVTNSNYASVMSILNTKTRLNAMHQLSGKMGSIIWNGKVVNKVTLEDIPRYAQVKIGDTIVTGGQSTIFPKGILIGKVEHIEEEKGGDNFKIQVELFNDMKSLSHAYVIINKDIEEVNQLINQVKSE